MHIKNKLAAVSCWLLREQYTPLELLYILFIGLAYRDFGLLSVELLMTVAIIASFNFLFRKITASMRIAYLLVKIEKYCKGIEK